MEGLPVSYSLNSGDNGNNWWGDFIGAAIGGAAGAAHAVEMQGMRRVFPRRHHAVRR